MHILIPVKQLDRGKSRLADVLDMEARKALCRFLLDRTLGLVDGLEWRLVTADTQLLEEFGERAIADQRGDLNGALEDTIEALGGPYVILPTDLPLATKDAVAALIASGPVAIAPDRRGEGTNALVVQKPYLMRLHFGSDSFRLHCLEARSQGTEPVILTDPKLAFDLDLPQDYRAWMAVPEAEAWRRELKRLRDQDAAQTL